MNLWFSPQKGISKNTLNLLFRQLATLLSAGVPIDRSIDIIANTSKQSQARSLLITIKNDITSGNPLSTALKKHPQYFNEFTFQLIRSGEQCGKLDSVLLRLCHHQKKSLLFVKKIKQAAFYPALVAITALITTLIMLLFIIPHFEELFATTPLRLPPMTRGVISLSHFLRNHTWIFFSPLLLVVLYSIAPQTIKRTLHANFYNSAFMNALLQKPMLAQFARALATLLSAGVPILDALKMTTHLHSHPHYIMALTKLRLNVNAGHQLHTAMEGNTFFPHLLTQLTRVGEESGNLEQMLEKVAEFYESDIDYLLNKLAHLIEPLIIMVLGVLIGGLVIAMYLPIFQLGTVI